MNKLSIEDIKAKKGKTGIAMLTCYDYSFAKALDEAGLDMILVGDSLANVVLGLEETRKVTFAEMLSHTKAVSSAAQATLIVADMPYEGCHKGVSRALKCAKEFVAAGADAVKIEWFDGCQKVIKKLIQNKIPVMGHIGLTPQTVHLLGGFKVQGKDKDSAINIIKQAKLLEELGIFSLILECLPYQLAHFLTKNVNIPTIGIGAGKFCDGQVLVLYDILGLYKKIMPKFVKCYVDFFSQTKSSAQEFVKEIRSGEFPSVKESFSIDEKQWEELSVDLTESLEKL